MVEYVNYVIKFPNGKHYVGYTKQGIIQRFKDHKIDTNKNPRTPLHFAMRKFQTAFSDMYLLDIFNNKQSALDNEKKLILDYFSHISMNGYNCTWGGECGSDNFGGSNWMKNKTQEELNVINAKKACPGERNGFYRKKHTEEDLIKAVTTRRERGSYDSENMAMSKPVSHNGIIYPSQIKLRKALGIGRITMAKLLADNSIQLVDK